MVSTELVVFPWRGRIHRSVFATGRHTSTIFLEVKHSWSGKSMRKLLLTTDVHLALGSEATSVAVHSKFDVLVVKSE